MSDNDQAQERTEEPTAKRQREAKRKGQVARSRELNTMMVVLVGGAAMVMLGPWMMTRLKTIMVQGLTAPVRNGFDVGAVVRGFAEPLRESAFALLPLAVVLLIASLVGPMLLGGILFSAEAATPKFDRLSPASGFKRIFSLTGLMELAKTLVKFAVLCGLAAVLLHSIAGELLGIGRMAPLDGMATAGKLMELVFMVLAAGLAVIAAIDVPFQIFNHLRQLRMTRQEIRDEMKETEGNPEVKAKIRGMQQQVARQRMMSDVPRADVVLTNPTHFAVALRYTDKPDAAPRVVAKGRGLIALKIREIAAEHHVCICEAPALARAIHKHTEIGHEIPAGLFLAVARVLAYVFELRAATGRRGALPVFPGDLPVPDDLAVAPEGAA